MVIGFSYSSGSHAIFWPQCTEKELPYQTSPLFSHETTAEMQLLYPICPILSKVQDEKGCSISPLGGF
jgi:hypothetical protein